MYSPFAPPSPRNSEDYFSSLSYSKNIDNIIPSSEILVDFRINGLRAKKPCLVYAEKIEFKGVVQIRITEKCDHRRMFISTVDGASFHELKHDQSLHVTFAGFIDNLMRLLQDCQAGKLELHIIQIMPPLLLGTGRGGRSDSPASCSLDGAEQAEFQLQFIEMRSFKNLIHLCLPCRLASLSLVVFYMNAILENMEKKLCNREQTCQQLQHELNAKQCRIEQMNNENINLRDSLVDNTRNLNKKHAEEIQQMQETLRQATEQRHSENEKHRKNLNSLQTQIEKLNIERVQLQAEKCQEHKRVDSLTEELNATRSQLSQLKETNENLKAEVTAVKNMERSLEHSLSEGRKHITELQDKLNKYDKARADLVAELEAEKKISQTKRHALEMATLEISKANEIILKQSQELIKLRRTIEWRTEVALQQEKAIQEKDKLLKCRGEEIQQLHETLSSMRVEIPKELESMRAFANSLERKYAEQIRSLREALKLKISTAPPKGKENYGPGKISNPTTLSRLK